MSQWLPRMCEYAAGFTHFPHNSANFFPPSAVLRIFSSSKDNLYGFHFLFLIKVQFFKSFVLVLSWKHVWIYRRIHPFPAYLTLLFRDFFFLFHNLNHISNKHTVLHRFHKFDLFIILELSEKHVWICRRIHTFPAYLTWLFRDFFLSLFHNLYHIS